MSEFGFTVLEKELLGIAELSYLIARLCTKNNLLGCADAYFVLAERLSVVVL